MRARASGGLWQDLPLAVLLAIVLCAAWAMRDWPNLSALRLPDTDDAVRLQQIRDWLHGQAFADLAQHRLGMRPGLEMHWSRLPDLVPAGLILVLAPMLGVPHAELAAVILSPAILLVAALALIGSIARLLNDGRGGVAPAAMIVAALAYPTASLFMPGRIDHHGLQLVLLLVLARATVAPGSLANGVAAGLAAAASLAIGLETAPLLAIGAAAIAIDWIRNGEGGQARLLGFGMALLLTLTAGAAVLRTSGWDYPACDGFDGQAWRAAEMGAIAVLALAIAGFAFVSPRARLAAATAAAVLAAAGALAVSPGCLRPYGAVDPVLARAWLVQVGEAQPLFAAPLAQAIGYCGLMLAGIAAAAWLARCDRRWLALLAMQAGALALAFFQLRGAYAGALLAAPALGLLIARARTRGLPALAGAWLISAGILYPLAGAAIAGGRNDGVARACTQPGNFARLAALPRGRVLASIDLGAYALAATPHELVAAPYHRNNAGNRALLDFLRGDAATAARIVGDWRVDYVALCPDDLAGAPGRMGAQLGAGAVPAWLVPLSQPGEAPQIYRVAR